MTLRQWLNAILSFIGTTSLTDVEYSAMNVLPLENGTYNQAAYDELSKVLATRELVSTMQNRLIGFFNAKGLGVTPADVAKSEIFLGAEL